jgi:uncharacterized membrane protein YfcA
MDYFILILVSFLASGLTLFSGFGLGTLLLPAFSIFFPVDIAIALTAIVHFLNNLFKLLLLGRNADKNILLSFGIPSVIAAFIGAYSLYLLYDLPPLYEYSLGKHFYSVTPVKFTIAIVMAFFACYELVPALSQKEFNKDNLIFGGFLSGFFGGLSGHQGALRSAFLTRAGLSKESFIATGVVIACAVDITRMTVYYEQIRGAAAAINYPLLGAAVAAAFAGAFLGNKLLKKVTIDSVKMIVGICLLLYAVAFGLGVL